MISAKSKAALTFRYDILHLHLPEVRVEKPLHQAAAIGGAFLTYVALAKLLRKKVVWTMHEVTPSLEYPLTNFFLKSMRSLTDGYIFMNRSSEAEYLRRYPEESRKTIWRVPHSAYPVAKISYDRLEEIRQTLTGGADCMLVGFLGEIRPYKNPAVLQFLPKTDARGRPLRIIAAGRYHASCNSDAMDAFFRNFDTERLVRLNERFSDEKLAEFIRATDLVLLPYLRGWNSGFAMFVLGSGGRILCSNLPMFRELADELGPPWVYLFDHTAVDLAKELDDAISRASTASPDAADRDRLQRFTEANSFTDAALRHVDLYRNLMGSKRVSLH